MGKKGQNRFDSINHFHHHLDGPCLRWGGGGEVGNLFCPSLVFRQQQKNCCTVVSGERVCRRFFTADGVSKVKLKRLAETGRRYSFGHWAAGAFTRTNTQTRRHSSSRSAAVVVGQV